MMAAPELMLSNSLALPATPATVVVTRWVGFAVFSLGFINMAARNDPGSPALVAVMTGNALFHALGIFFDVAGYVTATMTMSGLVSGVVPHALLLAGFLYYLLARPTKAAAGSVGSAA